MRSRRRSVDCGALVETDDVDCEAPDVAEVPDVDSEALFEVPDVAEAPPMGSLANIYLKHCEACLYLEKTVVNSYTVVKEKPHVITIS